MDPRKQTILKCLRAFIRSRPGLDWRNYGPGPCYRQESREITRDRHHAETLLGEIAWRDSLTADDIVNASKHAFSGRLEITEPTPGRFVISYCTGQYYPTEYRKAACAVLSSVLWEYWRSSGNDPRAMARAQVGRTIAGRWFQ